MLSRKLKKIALCVVIAALAMASVVAFVKIGKLEKTKDVGITSIKDEHALRSKHLSADKFNKIVIQDKPDVTYQIFYYNADKKFIGKSADLSADTTELEKTQTVETVTENVKYFRVVIKVTDTAKKVTIFNMNKYVNQVTVTLNK